MMTKRTGIRHLKQKFFFKVCCWSVLQIFLVGSIYTPSVYAKGIAGLPQVGTIVSLSDHFEYPLIRGITLDTKDPFRFEFLIDDGDNKLQGETFNSEAVRLVKYFLAALTIADQDLWVNLSPHERDRIAPQDLGVTELGRDLLAQDYLLKQMMSSLTYPESGLGQSFWNRVYARAKELYGTTDVSFDTFNKVWIVPDQAEVYETGNTVFVVKSRLRVMMEEDYVALRHEKISDSRQSTAEEQDHLRDVSAQVTKEVLLPELEREVNEGKNFAMVRQIYDAVILADWYKRRLRESLLGKLYVDRHKVTGVDVDDKEIKEKIFAQYLEAFKQGVYNYIREDYDPVTKVEIPRKYFSGGVNFGMTKVALEGRTHNWNDRDNPPPLATIVPFQRFMQKKAAEDGGGIRSVEIRAVGIGADEVAGKSSPSGQEPMSSSRRRAVSAATADFTRPDTLDAVVKEILEKTDIDERTRDTITSNLRIGYENAVDLFKKRYSQYIEKLDDLHFQIKQNLGVAAKTDNNTIEIDYDILSSLPRLTGELQEELDHYLNPPQGPQQRAASEFITDFDQIIYFLTLSYASKADYIHSLKPANSPLDFTSASQSDDLVFLKVLLQALDPTEFDAIKRILLEGYHWSTAEIEALEKQYKDNYDWANPPTPFQLALNYGLESPVYERGGIKANLEKDKDHYEKLAERYAANEKYIRDLRRQISPEETSLQFYHYLARVESKNSGIPPSLILLGTIKMDPENPIDQYLTSRQPRGPPFAKSDNSVAYTYIGGGGYSAVSIGRAFKWLYEKGKKRELPVYSLNVVSPYDDGGSSARDQAALRRFLGGRYVPSAGDYASIVSWQTVKDHNWFAEARNRNLHGYKPEHRNAIMDLIYMGTKRPKIDSDVKTVIDRRIGEVNRNNILINPYDTPDNWISFVINLRQAAELIDKELLENDSAYREELRKYEVSVQNLFLHACLISAGLRSGLTDKEANDILVKGLEKYHQALGVYDMISLPASVQDAVLSMVPKGWDKGVSDVSARQKSNDIDKQTNISDPANYHKEVADMFIYKKANGEDFAKGESPEAMPQLLDSMEAEKNGFILGMGSPFDSILPNLMIKKITEKLIKKHQERVPVVYFPKTTQDFQTTAKENPDDPNAPVKALSLKEMLLIMEKSIQYATGNDDFRIEQMMSHVFLPNVPQEVKDKYLELVKEEKKKYLNEAGQEALKNAKELKDLAPILTNRENWSPDTIALVNGKTIKPSKMIAFDMVQFNDEDRKFLKERKIAIMDIEDQSDLFDIWEGKVNYDPVGVAQLMDRFATSGTTLLANRVDSNTIEDFKNAGARAIKAFLDDFKDQRSSLPKEIQDVMDKYQADPKFVEVDQLIKRTSKTDPPIPRIEVRQSNGGVAQMAIILIPGQYAEKYINEYFSPEAIQKYKAEHPSPATPSGQELDGIAIQPSGKMTININVSRVNKGLPLGFLERHFDEILNQMVYQHGKINSRQTKTVVSADGFGVTFGLREAKSDPTFAANTARSEILKYLESGGIYMVISTNDRELIKEKLLAKDDQGNEGIPAHLRSRILISADGGATLDVMKNDGTLEPVKGYIENALKEQEDRPLAGSDHKGLDILYMGDDASEDGNDYPAFVKVGLERSVLIRNDKKIQLGELMQKIHERDGQSGISDFFSRINRLSSLGQSLASAITPKNQEIPLTRMGTLAQVVEDLRAHGENKRWSDSRVGNLTEAMQRASEVVGKRYPNEIDRIRNLRLQVRRDGSLVQIQEQPEVGPDGTTKDVNVVVINLDLLASLSRLTGELIREMDIFISNPDPSKPIELASAKLFSDVEQLLYFQGLSVESKADYIDNMVGKNDLSQVSPFLDYLIRSIEFDRSDREFSRIKDILKNSYRWNKKPTNLDKLTEKYRSRTQGDTTFSLALDYGRTYYPDSFKQQLENPRFNQLWAIYDKNVAVLKATKREFSPTETADVTYRQIARFEANETGVSPTLIFIGLLNLDENNPIDAFLLRRQPQVTPMDKAEIEYAFLGGGGFLAVSIGRAFKWLYERVKGDKSPDYYMLNVVTPYDNGGSSARDQKAVQKAVQEFIPSPGDTAAIMSWHAIHDKNWFADPANKSLRGFKPEQREAKMDLMYQNRKRITVPEGQTLLDVLTQRINEILQDPQLNNSDYFPANWSSFVVNLRAAVQILSDQLMDKGFMDYIMKDKTSVQNLLNIAVATVTMKNGQDFSKALERLHQIMGIERTYVVPGSTEEAVLSLRHDKEITIKTGAKPGDDIRNTDIDGQTGISDGDYKDRQNAKPQQLLFKRWQNGKLVEIPVNEAPKIESRTAAGLRNIKKAILMGMGSDFDSLLPNLMLREMPQVLNSMQKEKGIKLVYLPKATEDLQTQGLSLHEIFDVMERSIKHYNPKIGSKDFELKDIITEVFIPEVPDSVKRKYLAEVKSEAAQYLISDKLDALNKANNIAAVKQLLVESNFNALTKDDLKSGVLKLSKIIPGEILNITREDIQYLQEKGINLIYKEDQSTLFRIWEGHVNYDPDGVAKLVDNQKEWPIVTPEAMIAKLRSKSTEKVPAPATTEGGVETAEKASPSGRVVDEKGGIAFDYLDLVIKRDGDGIVLPVELQNLEAIEMEGLRPVIIRVSTVSVDNFDHLLGFQPGEPADRRIKGLSRLN